MEESPEHQAKTNLCLQEAVETSHKAGIRSCVDMTNKRHAGRLEIEILTLLMPSSSRPAWYAGTPFIAAHISLLLT